MPQTISPSFKAKHITRSYEQTINADPARVFDLLCPVKEAEWLDGWDYTLLHSESGLAEEGCVFLSRQEGEKDTIWMITKRDVGEPRDRICARHTGIPNRPAHHCCG